MWPEIQKWYLTHRQILNKACEKMIAMHPFREGSQCIKVFIKVYHWTCHILNIKKCSNDCIAKYYEVTKNRHCKAGYYCID